jgi:hypothetical protein
MKRCIKCGAEKKTDKGDYCAPCARTESTPWEASTKSRKCRKHNQSKVANQ